MSNISHGKVEVNAKKLKNAVGNYAVELSEQISRLVKLNSISDKENFEEMRRKANLGLLNKMKRFLDACEEAYALYVALDKREECILEFEKEV